MLFYEHVSPRSLSKDKTDHQAIPVSSSKQIPATTPTTDQSVSMRLSLIAAVSVLGFAAQGHTAPSNPPAPPLEVVTFETTGSADGGFVIPDGTPPGVYMVTTDENGVSHHTKIDGINPPNTTISDNDPSAMAVPHVPRAETGSGKAGLVARDNQGCPGYTSDINHGDLQTISETVYWRLYNNPNIAAGYHVYSVTWGPLVTFVCNHYSGTITFGSDLYWDMIYRVIWSTCGAWRGGWYDFASPPCSVGYHLTSGNNVFCNQAHA